ncbi:hypothetical protein H5410_000399 [Solanum commersonii]|uniref:Uncharacterized protein n=1 Tax=Solanum commersonii TaxID=4109 RepID=A0A9J6AWN6_SOLCO|nr:hypothetical protein H5410_000399 [Solanum commersonii]
MPNSNSSLKTPLSQEVENPSLFDFSIPTPEESPSTPVCGGGEMAESFTPQTEVVASHVSLSDEVLVCSPTLVLSGDKSQNSEAQFVAKPGAELFSEETEVGSLAVSSTISERLFEGDLPEGRGPDSCILTAGVPHGSQLVFDQTLISLGIEDDEEEEEDPQLRWRSRGVRGTNPSQIREERKRKGKGKLVKTYLKGETKRYGTRSVTQKVLGSAMEANVAQN